MPRREEKMAIPMKDKRTCGRKSICQRDRICLEIVLPVPKGARITKQICDISDGGLSFVMPSEEGYLVPGTPIEELYVNFNGRLVRKSWSEVIYVKEFARDGGVDYKIGIQFREDVGHKPSLLGAGTQYRVRPKRYDVAAIKDVTGLVKFVDKDNDEIVGDILNFSRYGIAFRVQPERAPLKKSETLERFSLIIDNEIVFEGRVTIVDIWERENEWEVRAIFDKDLLDVESIFLIKKKLDIEQEFRTYFETFTSKSEKLNKEYKDSISNIRYFCESLKCKLDQIESDMKDEVPTTKQRLENEILNCLMMHFSKYLDEQLIALNNIAANFLEKEDHIHKQYFQNQLHHLILLAPFIDRVYRKPLGYAGDYEMINMIYRKAYEGDSLFSKLLHKYTVSLPPAQAHRKRVPFILDTIRRYAKTKLKKEPLRVLSIGSGPAKEAQEFLRANGESMECAYTLIDFDRKALTYCQEQLLNLKYSKKYHRVKLSFISLSVRELLRRADKIDELKDQDIIYVFGLFDYLPAKFCRGLLKILFKNLREKGEMLISNVHKRNVFRCYMEHGGEWYLYYRDEGEMMEMGDGINSGNRLSVTHDQTKNNIFLILEK
jgi:extracellular factor (EF) 3-hydroxypalmitic acid methyl ester biosynthesis protein